jgi:hypothetical protein
MRVPSARCGAFTPDAAAQRAVEAELQQLRWRLPTPEEYERWRQERQERHRAAQPGQDDL